jgi:hypothetical protein
MGAGQSCTNVNFSLNKLCSISHCVDSVESMGTKSASPTNVLFLKMKPGTSYEDRYVDHDKQLSLKLFIDPITTVPVETYDGIFRGSYTLLYEMDIYEKIVAPMFYYNINPHFVKYYGSALGCDGKNIMDILTTQINRNDAEYFLDRNTVYMGYGIGYCPNILKKDTGPNAMVVDGYEYFYIKDQFNPKYGMILTERTDGLNVSDFFEHVCYNALTQPAWSVIIQIVTALDALGKFKCAHNDLHFGNIFVDSKPEEWVRYTYTDGIDLKSFKLKTNYTAAIYDWDRSYSEFIGDNPSITDKDCKSMMNCNEYIPQRDLMKIITQILLRGMNDSDILINLVFKDDFAKNKYKKLIKDGSRTEALFLYEKGIGTMTDFSGIKTPAEFLTSIIEYTEGYSMVDTSPYNTDEYEDHYNTNISEKDIESFITYNEWETARDEGDENTPFYYV